MLERKGKGERDANISSLIALVNVQN